MASRQKSCVPCAKAKRRCEPQTPQCSRCLKRGIDCYYINQPVKHLNQRHEPRRRCGSGRLPLPDTVPILEFASTASVSDEEESPDRWTRPSNEQSDTLSVQRYHHPNIRHVHLLGFHPGCPIMVSTVDRWPIHILSRSVASWPERFARNLEAPFLHPSLRDAPSLPHPLEEAFGACASYFVAKTASTRSMAMNMIGGKVNQLLGQDVSVLPIESLLASLQAFLILHTIQLWDGDAGQRTQAEMHSYIIESWALELHMRVETAEKQEAPLTWDRWITLESARRTAIVTLLAQGIYEMKRFGVCSYVPRMAEMSFTTGDGPWDAKTQSDWEEAVGYTGAIVANYIDYANAWKRSAVRDSPSAFGKLMLLPCLGAAHIQMRTSSQVEVLA
ncbi:hypothetical protein F4779DRAFT_611731 [Xylariaceae sp. FL0662B]|nr:hypothetical protein F4779DRAFT_611731 [Xylariaceae sp. FL0662B]